MGTHEYPWIPQYPRVEGTGRARVSHLSNGAETGIILSVPMGTH